ncbi:MAG: ferrous iron transport protein B [Clostridia bacterium]|nr:ferrous iron transport protein B [Clostridia bacterium]
MGLTIKNCGKTEADAGFAVKKRSPLEVVVALAGNPNVGKSTVFNALTGMNQHTGNWPGKTVSTAQGRFGTPLRQYLVVDLPGTYSLAANSAEEEAARDFICFGAPDVVVVVCDATALERSFNLVLQIMEISENVIVCVNLMDEAAKKHISVDLGLLSARLGVPVVGVTARDKPSLSPLTDALDATVMQFPPRRFEMRYSRPIEEALEALLPAVEGLLRGKPGARWLCLKLLESDESLLRDAEKNLGPGLLEDPLVAAALFDAREILKSGGISAAAFLDKVAESLVLKASEVCLGAVTYGERDYDRRDRAADRILTSRWGGYPIMAGLLLIVFWLTLAGANYPSQLLSGLFFRFQEMLLAAFDAAGAPVFLRDALVLGVYRVLSWVVSVMLPPMAIFFPLFTLLEDSGYLPRVAYNLDSSFKKCSACGKQALTMCMGFGCNAAGVTGCRIIDSPRERLIAIITNSFVPCNGRFPTLTAIITMFFIGFGGGFWRSALSALLLTVVIVLGVAMTLLTSKLLSLTVLRGVPSSFVLELPPYRRPQIGKVIVRSIFDRTLFVLGRAAAVAAPAGLIIWLTANITVGDSSLLSVCAAFLDPFARFFGLDGVILIAFILGFPANEIVVPIIIMAYMSTGSIMELPSLESLRLLLVQNGWTWVTACCVILFSLFHWPCSTTLITIRRETGSAKWTAVAFLAPTIAGFLFCFLFAGAASLF